MKLMRVVLALLALAAVASLVLALQDFRAEGQVEASAVIMEVPVSHIVIF